MSNNNRPLSPHLQVYKPQITSILSILHRITGAGLALGAVLVTVWLWAALSGDEAFGFVQMFRESIIGQIMLFGWSFAFLYHMLNGIRHLKWDVGFGINMPSVYRSGWVVVIGALAVSVLLWFTVGAQ